MFKKMDKLSVIYAVLSVVFGLLLTLRQMKVSNDKDSIDDKFKESLSSDIEEIKKSSKNIEKDPILRVQMAGKGIRLEGEPPNHFRLDFRCDDAGATNFNLKTYVLIVFNNGQYLLEEPSLFEKDTKFSSTSLAMMPISKTVKNVKYLYFYITGSYSNLSMTKNYSIDEVYRYQSDTEKTWGLGWEDKQKVVNEITRLSRKS